MSLFVRGIPKVKAALERVEAEVKAGAPAASKAAAEIVARAAASRAPRNTGATAASIRVDTDGETAHVGPTTRYARFPEFGTRYMSGQHYMQDAADASHGSVVAAIAAVLKAAIR